MTKAGRLLGSAVSVSILAVMVSGYLYGQTSGTKTSSPPSPTVDAVGNILVPKNYRTAYEYLGTWSVAGDEGAEQLHVVYASPGTAAAYRSTGKFSDGVVLVKEVYDAATSAMTTGTVSHADHLKGWFVMVKDTHNSHPDNKLWGEGWGWSWFDVGNSVKTTSTDFRSNCLGCHVPAKATDSIYVQGYPALRK